MQVDGLLQIGPEQERIAGAQSGPHLAQKFFARIAVEVADGAAEKEHQNMVALVAPFSHRAQPFEVGLFVTDDAHQIDMRQFLFAGGQGVRRNFDGVVIRDLPTRQRFENPARLFPRAAAEFRYAHWRRQAVHDFLGILLQQTRVSARESVFRQNANGFEQRGTHFVIQVF